MLGSGLISYRGYVYCFALPQGRPRLAGTAALTLLCIIGLHSSKVDSPGCRWWRARLLIPRDYGSQGHRAPPALLSRHHQALLNVIILCSIEIYLDKCLNRINRAEHETKLIKDLKDKGLFIFISLCCIDLDC